MNGVIISASSGPGRNSDICGDDVLELAGAQTLGEVALAARFELEHARPCRRAAIIS